MFFALLIIIIIVLFFNYMLVTKTNECKLYIDNMKEQEKIDELIDVYVNVPDQFKQYYINNNYDSLDQVTAGIFNDPNILVNS